MNIKEFLADVWPIIEKFAPTIAKTLNVPGGLLVGYVLPILASTFRVTPAEINQLPDIILADPSAEQKLEDVEHIHKDWLCHMVDKLGKLDNIDVKLNFKEK